MTTPDWTSEIVEAMARAEFEHETPPDEGTWDDTENRWKAEYIYRCKATLTVALPMIGKVIVEQCVPGGTHCDPQQIADDIRALTEPKGNGGGNG